MASTDGQELSGAREHPERSAGNDLLTIDAFPGVTIVARDLLPDTADHFVDRG